MVIPARIFGKFPAGKNLLAQGVIVRWTDLAGLLKASSGDARLPGAEVRLDGETTSLAALPAALGADLVVLSASVGGFADCP